MLSTVFIFIKFEAKIAFFNQRLNNYIEAILVRTDLFKKYIKQIKPTNRIFVSPYKTLTTRYNKKFNGQSMVSTTYACG